jgi:hypothetical protein
MNSKVKVNQTRHVLRWTWLNLNLSLAGLSWPLYLDGHVSRNRSSSIQITVLVHDTDSYFDYD